MAHPSRPDKIPHSQYLVQLGYNGRDLYGVTPQADGDSVWDLLTARLARAAPYQAPYAISWAARTDRGVHARINWVSFRLRDGGGHQARQKIIEAAIKPAHDVLTAVHAVCLSKRVMARNLAAKKIYHYLVPGGPAIHADALARLEAAARVLCGDVDVRRLAHARTVSRLADSVRRGLRVHVERHRAGLVIVVSGPGFLRHQVRHMAQGMQAVMLGQVRLADLAWLAQGHAGPLTQGLGGPAPAGGLTLARLVPWVAYEELLAPLKQASAPAAFEPAGD